MITNYVGAERLNWQKNESPWILAQKDNQFLDHTLSTYQDPSILLRYHYVIAMYIGSADLMLPTKSSFFYVDQPGIPFL